MTCLFCLEDTAKVDTCVPKLFLRLAAAYLPIVYGHPSEGWSRLRITPPPRCPGCNVIMGAIHHAGCKFERCPYCLPSNQRRGAPPEERNSQHTLHEGIQAALCTHVTAILRKDKPDLAEIEPARV